LSRKNINVIDLYYYYKNIKFINLINFKSKYMDRYKILKTLGDGTYGSVVKATNK
jgi:hypothetical protein